MASVEAGLAHVIQLRRGLQTETAFVQNMLRQGKTPDDAQMTSYLSGLRRKTFSLASLPGMETLEEDLATRFAAIGWDYRADAPAGLLPQLAAVVFWLQSVVAYLGEKIPAIKQAKKTSLKPSSAELQDVQLACERLWILDDRLIPGKDFELDLQRGKNSSWHQGDLAPRPLFKFVKDGALESPAFKTFIQLLDNYEACTGTAEVVTQEERREERAFLNAIADTEVVKYLGEYLTAKKMIKSPAEVQEKAGIFDYMGYVKPRRRATNSLREGPGHEHLLSLQFEWGGVLKPVSTCFIGTTPAFEIALFTLCFLSGQEENRLALGAYKVMVRCHTFSRGMIGTAFPEELPLDQEEAATKIQASSPNPRTTPVAALMHP
ncbi:hypothetical protein T484DRAFT_1910223 [Baffinella frigidus]|nr:hypothetical protein T484DRAFT_1910223 [Cryptophyta sp. CCMP2293]